MQAFAASSGDSLLGARAADRQIGRRRQALDAGLSPTNRIPGEYKMTDAVIVSTARTGLAKSWKGAFNMTHGATLGGHSVKHAVARAKLDPAEVEDVLMGCATPEGATGSNIARQIALAAGLPVTVPGATVNRFCSSGLQTIAMAAQRIIAGEGDIFVAGGVESISCVQQEVNRHMITDPALLKMQAGNLLEHAADRRAGGQALQARQGPRMDEYGVRSQLNAAAAQAAGKFNDEIVPMTVTMGVADKATGQLLTKQVTIAADEGIRPDTTLEGVVKIRSAIPGGVITAGNASQFSDGSSASVVMNAKVAEQKGLSRSASSAALPWPAANPTRWASARCSPYPSC
jgi:acetyl-CoA C-acetyltransferase